MPKDDTAVFAKYNDNKAVFSFSFLRVECFELLPVKKIEIFYEEPHMFLRITPIFKIYPSYNYHDFSYLNLMVYRLYILELTPGVDYTDYCQIRDQINDNKKVKFRTSFKGNKDNTMFIVNFIIREKLDPKKTIGIVQATMNGTEIDAFYPVFKLNDGSTMTKSDFFDNSEVNIIYKTLLCLLLFVVIYSLIYAKKYKNKVSKDKKLIEDKEKDEFELEVIE